MNVEIAALAEDVITQLYGKPMPNHQRCHGLVLDGALHSCFGLTRINGELMFFSDVSEKGRQYIRTRRGKRTLVTANRIAQEVLEEVGLPVLARANRNYAGADDLLRHFGFTVLDVDLYVWQPTKRRKS